MRAFIKKLFRRKPKQAPSPAPASPTPTHTEAWIDDAVATAIERQQDFEATHPIEFAAHVRYEAVVQRAEQICSVGGRLVVARAQIEVAVQAKLGGSA